MENFIKKTLFFLGVFLFVFQAKAEKISSFDWTDKAVVTASAEYQGTDLSKLTDNSSNTILQAGFTSGMWVQFAMPQDFKISGYALTAGSALNGAPKKWTLEGSNNGIEWTSVDSRSEQTFSVAKDTKSYQLNFPSDRETIKSYKYIRITFTENGGGTNLELSELQLFGFPVQLVTNITGNGGVISSQYAGYTGEGVENLTNNLISKKYCVVGQSKGWIEYESPSAVMLSGYSLTSCVANVERDPKSWTLAGYNETTALWETIDNESSQDFMMRFSTLEYKVQPTQSYNRFRLTITQNNGDGNFQFCKLQLFGTETSAPKIKVACVGNSITENSALPEDKKYPSLLQSYLGSDYQVRNYGLGGRTLLKKGNMPYWNEAKYTEVKNWNSNIVIIKLGTNDSKASNWKYKDEFVSNYVEFINSFKNLSNSPKIFICKPLPAYPNTMNIDGTVIHDEILPMIEEIAQQTGVDIIDLYTPLEGKRSYLYDDVHPNEKGTTIMAHHVCKAIEPTHSIPDGLYSQVSTFDWTDLAVSIKTSESHSASELAKLTDNNLTTDFKGGVFKANSWIEVEMPEMFKLTGYALSAGNTPANAPKSWVILGSIDGTTWYNIESQSGVQYLRQQETNVYQTTLPDDRETLKAYKYYRIRFVENNGGNDLDLSEWQIYGFPAQLVTNITGNGGSIKGQYAGFDGEGVGNLINNLISKKYCVNGSSTGWMEYESASKVKLEAYSLTSCVTEFERNPKDWTLEAYNYETRTWDVLDTQTNQDFAVRYNTMVYKVETNKSYTKFRVNVTKNNGGGIYQVCKWQLMGEETSAPIQKTKVACIGNSITANAKLNYEDRYPSILQDLLGEEYTVENFGVGGATLLKGSSYPYWDRSAYTSALAFVPDVIVVKLGTNDSNPDNWKKKANFVTDYVDFINSFKAVNPNVKVYTCYPITSWNSTMPIVDKTVTDEIMPMIDQIAAQTGATVIDLHNPTFGKVYQTYDYVHPDVRGTTLMANIIYKALEPGVAEPYMNPAYISNVDSFDRTDYVVTSSSSANVKLSNLFDNNLETEVDFGSFTSDMSFQFELPENFRATGYSITSGKGDIKNAPKSWEFQGSANGSTWTTIETRTNQSFSYPTETSMYQIAIENNTSGNAENLPVYKYYRVVFRENHGGTQFALAEFQLYGMNETMVTSITGNGGTITGQYPGYQNGDMQETVDKLINNSISQKYCAPGHPTGWVQYESTKSVLLGGYSISNAIHIIERNLKAWELLGSTDGVNWDVIDKQENQNFFMRLNTIEYKVNPSKEYKYFKLNILENYGGSEFQFAKWQLFENIGSGVDSNSSDEFVKVFSKNGEIHFQSSSIFDFSIYSSTGKLLITKSCEAGNYSEPIHHDGLYLVRVQSEGEMKTMKILF